ncbi:LAETG motif-containing sortase-dependent surface protein [Streptomyces sp. NPDC047841]|uniref:LAETG motif-containing sortase-dependent surface protein n=1 Tax=Streptomyces sp. NPDC047841 TaxID=3154708 RepID=UPI0034523049
MTQTAQLADAPGPVTVGGSGAGTTDLAATGGSALTPVLTLVIAGVAIGLVVIGGAVPVVLRKRDTTPGA